MSSGRIRHRDGGFSFDAGKVDRWRHSVDAMSRLLKGNSQIDRALNWRGPNCASCGIGSLRFAKGWLDQKAILTTALLRTICDLRTHSKGRGPIVERCQRLSVV